MVTHQGRNRRRAARWMSRTTSLEGEDKRNLRGRGGHQGRACRFTERKADLPMAPGELRACEAQEDVGSVSLSYTSGWFKWPRCTDGTTRARVLSGQDGSCRCKSSTGEYNGGLREHARVDSLKEEVGLKVDICKTRCDCYLEGRWKEERSRRDVAFLYASSAGGAAIPIGCSRPSQRNFRADPRMRLRYEECA